MQRKYSFGIIAGLILLTTQSGYADLDAISKGVEPVFGLKMPVLNGQQITDMKRNLADGKPYIHTEESGVHGCVWPKIYAYTVLDTNPKQAAAYLFDVELDAKAFPDDVKSSTIVDYQSEDTAKPIVEFDVRLIPLKPVDGELKKAIKDLVTDKFRMNYNLERKLKDGQRVYSIQKEMPHYSRLLRFNEAYTYLEPYGEDKTLFVYHSFVCPHLLFAPIAQKFVADVLGKADQVAALEKSNIEKQSQVDLDGRISHLKKVFKK